MNEKTKKNLLLIVGGVLLVLVGIWIGRSGRDGFVPGDLSIQLEQSKSQLRESQLRISTLEQQLEQRAVEIEGFKQHLSKIECGIDESLGLAEQAGKSLGCARDAIRESEYAVENGGNIIKQLRELNKQLKKAVGELSDTNSRLENQLRELSTGTSKQ